MVYPKVDHFFFFRQGNHRVVKLEKGGDSQNAAINTLSKQKIIGGEIYELYFKTRRHSKSERKGVFA